MVVQDEFEPEIRGEEHYCTYPEKKSCELKESHKHQLQTFCSRVFQCYSNLK